MLFIYKKIRFGHSKGIIQKTFLLNTNILLIIERRVSVGALFTTYEEKNICKLDVRTYICVVKLEDALKMTRFSSPKHKAGLNLLYTSWWLKTIISKELKALGLTQEQFNVLRILKGKYPEAMCVKDIGSRMIEQSSNVPRIIDRLVAKEHVTRSTSEIDKRETVISLTNSGIDNLLLANQKVEKLFTNAISISEDEAAALDELLEKMREKE